MEVSLNMQNSSNDIVEIIFLYFLEMSGMFYLTKLKIHAQ